MRVIAYGVCILNACTQVHTSLIPGHMNVELTRICARHIQLSN